MKRNLKPFAIAGMVFLAVVVATAQSVTNIVDTRGASAVSVITTLLRTDSASSNTASSSFLVNVSVLPVAPAPAPAEGVIPLARRVEWAGNVGVPGGIPDSGGMRTFLDFPAEVSLQVVQAAINACPENQVVRLGVWTNAIPWVGTLDWYGVRNGVVLTGSKNANGTPATGIVSANMRILMRAPGSENNYSVSANLSESAGKGDASISLVNMPTWIRPGSIVAVDQLDDPDISINPGQEQGKGYRQIMGNGPRGVAQMLRVLTVDGNRIEFTPPLAMTFSTSFAAQVFKPFAEPTNFRTRCGMENLVLVHTGPAASMNNMIQMEGCDSCWLKNIHGVNMVGGMYVWGVASINCEVRHCSFQNSKQIGSGNGYGVALYHFCTGWLVEDNIFSRLHCAMQINYGSCYNVFAYNFETAGQSESGQNPSMSTHGTTAHNNVFEGNWCMDKFLADFTHGSGYRNTAYRNRIVGKNPTQTSDQAAVSIELYNRGCNVAGNVMGDFGWHIVYMNAPSAAGYVGSSPGCSDRAVVKLGFWSNFGCNAKEVDTALELDALLVSNYDTASASAVVLTRPLPESYFRTEKPAWFNGLDWPPFSPEKTTASALSFTNIPAGYRWQFGSDP